MNHNGPWCKADYSGVYPGYNDDENDILDAKGRLVATTTEWEDKGTPNADLVEAAPELLEALFEHCSMIHKRWGEGCNQKEADAAIKAAMNAIEKAKGGTK